MGKILVPLILAGGKGSRLWPLSRENYAKQFLRFDGAPSLLQSAYDRGKSVAKNAVPHIIAGTEQKALVLNSLREKESVDYEFIAEPYGRDTAPAIFYGCCCLERKYPDAVAAVFPADHFIADADRFCANIRRAAALSEKNNAIVLLGIKPTYPADCYGYAELGKRVNGTKGQGFYVRKFREKPSKDRAKKYIKSGDYLWNSGIFIFPLSLMREIREEMIGDSSSEAIYEKMEPISFDCCVLEKRRDILILKADFDWNDVGNYRQLSVLLGEDDHHNVVRGHCVLNDVSDSVILSDQKLTAVIGVKDLVVIEDHGVLLVCGADKTEVIKDVVGSLVGEDANYR